MDIGGAIFVRGGEESSLIARGGGRIRLRNAGNNNICWINNDQFVTKFFEKKYEEELEAGWDGDGLKSEILETLVGTPDEEYLKYITQKKNWN